MQVIADPRRMAGEKDQAADPRAGHWSVCGLRNLYSNPGLTLVCLSIGLPTDCGVACNALHAQTSAVDYMHISRAVS